MAKKIASQESTPKFSESEIVKAAIEVGAKKAKIVSPKKVVTAHWVRWKCCYGCSAYQTNLMCPPYTPLPAETRQMLDQYKRAIFFEAGRGHPKKIAVALEKKLFLQGFYKAFGMGAGPCHLCKECAFEQGCRKPEWRALHWRLVESMYLLPHGCTALQSMLFATKMMFSTTSASF
jgi:predicted metal-binding protein